ncbi:kinase-like protein [Coprinopsis marcescibilis]|uniref:Kinase-like protein n=1 Tax=Coprinopsis marcescibilis TaxID=230819 RepID=A0A5C3KZ93_COPMA|nr:kinase-like protein [Coprinopsis marcescibilis]
MSQSELYMQDSNDSFDLPRWQTHVDPLSSSAQAAHGAQTNYMYSGPPPPPQQSLSAASPQRLQPLHQTPTGPSRQPRISQLLEQEHSMNPAPNQYSTPQQGQLARSTSLGGGNASNLASRLAARRHNPQDDIEAYATDAQPLSGPRQQPQIQQNSFYNPSLGYQSPSMTGTVASNSSTGSTSDAYSDMYYNGSTGHPPKRIQDPNRAAGRSPHRVPNSSSSAPLIDPYAQQQSQYSPTTATYPYGPGPPLDQRAQSAVYQTHSRNNSNIKTESATPPISSVYASQNQPGQTHLSTHVPIKQQPISSPPTPMSFMQGAVPGSHYYSQDQSMLVDPPPKRRASGFRRVRTVHDLQPRLDISPNARRMASDGTYLSPLRQLTTNIVETYRICNPGYRYESTHNPRRVLTKPSKPAHNEGYDNEDYDYILYVNDWLGSEDNRDRYLILDILGQGTFGQVVKCQNMKTHEIVAVKVVKNKPAYFNQSMMEVTILEMLNKTCDPNDEHHILRLRDSFIHRSHLCLVFELLSSNLYELIKQNQFQGLSTQLVKVFMAQLLDALTVLKEARLIHCDLKPENILLKSLQSPQIKVIDFGSACHERQTVYTYIQSRFYRSPEVLLGMSYTASIDMWSLGCIAVELFLGLPLFPGTSEYNQLTRIVEMLGMPVLSMLNTGKQTSQFFDSYDVYNPQLQQHEKRYRLKSIEKYSREHNTNEQPGKQYFKATSLPEIINTAPMPSTKSSRSQNEIDKELNNRAAFIDFCKGLLDLNPVTRWTPQQARLHPFITGEKFTKPFVPDGLVPSQSSSSSPNTPDPKRPYGGLVPSQPKGARAYQDAAHYAQQVNQQQVFNAQAATQAANTFRNPYINPPAPQQQQPQQQQPQPPAPLISTPYTGTTDPYHPQTQQQQSQQMPSQYPGAIPSAPHRSVPQQGASSQLSPGSSGPQYLTHSSSSTNLSTAHLSSGTSSGSYHPGSRARATTINQMDSIPPALARLQHMNQDIIGGRNALTPVLNRDDAMKEWERRQSGKPPTTQQPYQPLEYLTQQAEMVAASGFSNWASGPHTRYPAQPSKLQHSYQPHGTIMVEDEGGNGRRVATAASGGQRTDQSGMGSYPGNTPMIASPPQAYAPSNPANRYTTGYGQPTQHQSTGSSSSFDNVDRRSDLGSMYVPMQPDQYQAYPVAPSSSTSRHIPPTGQPIQTSFYGPSVVPSGAQQQRNPFNVPDSARQAMGGPNDNTNWPR